ncbi:MAG: ABC transporter permease [Bacillota bacterium]|nr:ABC transporter permease [Bacillota bacterium]
MRTIAVAKRLIRQIGGDKRSIALLFLAPIFVMYLLNVILTSGAVKYKIDLISAPESFIKEIKKEADISEVQNENTAIQNLKSNKSDAYIVFNSGTSVINVEGSDPTKTGAIINKINKVNLQLYKNNLPQTKKNVFKNPEIKLLYGTKDMSVFDSIAPLLMGFFIFFFVFLLSGISFLRERISGTLERILATPIKRSEIVFGYFIGFGIFAGLQTIIIQTFMVYGMHITMKGSFLAILVINLLLAAGSLTLGTLLSAFARNEFQLFQFIPVIIVPQMLFSGVFDLSAAPIWIKVLSKIFPMTYGADALKNIMIRGKSISDIIFDVLILAGYALLFMVMNILVLKKYRKS